MKFRTEIQMAANDRLLTYTDQSLFIGSCFTENVGAYMLHYKYEIDVNPFGIQYNPASVAQSLQLLIEQRQFVPHDLQFTNEKWFSFAHHGSFSDSNQKQCLTKINQRIQQTSQKLSDIQFLFITFGTAWVYDLLETKQLVSNCHKLPASHFVRRKLSVAEIVTEYNTLIKRLQELNPKLQVIFTISPIRHLKDGLVENQRSKATLVLAVESLVEQHAHVRYFPAYEILMDDLRDYRFYAYDMLHPSKQAVEYVWAKFVATFLDPNDEAINRKMDKLQKALLHRPTNPRAESYQRFAKKQLKIIQAIKAGYSIDLEKEAQFFRAVLYNKKG